MSKLLFFVPVEASSVAGKVDLFFFFMVAVSTFFAVLIAALIAVFAIRYRRGRAVEAEATPGADVELEPHQDHGGGAMALEIVWTVIPLALAMVMFVWSARLYFTIARPPADAIEMYAVGKQWMWKFQHPEGRREINELHVPVDQDVRISLSSEDVIHSFFVPAFRVKQDAVPGRYTQTWFRATRVGTYHLFCAEYCGTQHSGMIGRVIVMKPDEYQAWLSGGGGGVPGQTLAQAGEKLFTERACASCHLENGQGPGPSLAGLPGSTVKLKDGGTVVADDTYLRESILNPAAKVVAGYQPVMPTFQGQLSEEQLVQLLAYIKSLGAKQNAAPVAAAGAGAASGPTSVQAGEKLFTERACASCHLENGKGPGPSLAGLPGSTVKLQGGGTAVANDAYLRESILDPTAKVVAGYPPAMPPFQGQLSDEQLAQLIAYIKSLGAQAAGPVTPRAPGAPSAKD